MHCPNCGFFNQDGNRFCAKCGSPLPQTQPPQQPQYGQPQQSPYAQPQQSPYAQPQQSPYGQPQQPYYAQPQQQKAAQAPQFLKNAGSDINSALASKNFFSIWHVFLTYCGFFLAAIIFFFVGLGDIVGWQYGKMSAYGYSFKYVDIVKSSYGGLRAIDIISGIIFIGLAGAAVYTWMQFRKYKKPVPKMTLGIFGGFLGLYLLSKIIHLIVFLADGADFGSAVEVMPIAFPIILMIFMGAILFANLKYFKAEGNKFMN